MGDGSRYDPLPEGCLIGGYDENHVLYVNLYPGQERLPGGSVDEYGYSTITDGLDSTQGLFFAGEKFEKIDMKQIYQSAIADKLNEHKDYLETENWPFLITHFGEKCEKPSRTAILNASLRALVNSFEAPPRDGYFQGKQGYEKWIAGLRNDSLWDTQCPQNDLGRRFDVHLSTTYQLVDARRCAAAYLTECCALVSQDIAALLMEMADTYRGFTEHLHTFKEELLKTGVSCFLGSDSGKAMRKEQVLLLESALQEEFKNVETAKQIMKLFEYQEDSVIKNDDAIVKPFSKMSNVSTNILLLGVRRKKRMVIPLCV